MPADVFALCWARLPCACARARVCGLVCVGGAWWGGVGGALPFAEFYFRHALIEMHNLYLEHPGSGYSKSTRFWNRDKNRKMTPEERIKVVSTG